MWSLAELSTYSVLNPWVPGLGLVPPVGAGVARKTGGMLRPYCVTPWDEDPQGSHMRSLMPRASEVPSGYRQGKEGLERGRDLQDPSVTGI